MIALWSRAVRNPGTCRYITCLSNASVATRHTGPIGLRGAWAFGTPTSTFLYTAVFAAGLAIDAKAKHNRNEQWNTAFDSIREELRQAPTEGETASSIHQEDDTYTFKPLVDELDWDAASKAVGMDSEDLIDHSDSAMQQTGPDTVNMPEMLWDLLPLDTRLPGAPMLDWPANSGPGPGTRYNLPPQSLWALEAVRLKTLRIRQTQKKLAIQELSICALIHKLLKNCKGRLSGQDALESLSFDIGRIVNLSNHENDRAVREIRANITALETLKIEDWPNDTMTARISPKLPAEPYFHQDSDGDYHHIAEQLNLAIKTLFDDYQKRCSDPEMIGLATAKICHNLLISTAAPNLQTFNILLAGFKKWKQPRLVDNVIKSVEDCKIRSNEITCAIILDHYAETERPVLFSRFVAKMRGADNALMLAAPHITENEKGAGRLVRVNETKVYQKVYPTPIVFHALMRGVLKFAGFERAMDIYYEMKEDGWGLDMPGLSHFLQDCIHRADWQGGLLVWEEIANIQSRINPKDLADAYARFLGLCSVVQKPAAFNSVLKDVVKRGYDRLAILKMAKEFSYMKKGYLAPAWTADNLLIAVSDYMTGDKATEDEAAPFFEESKDLILDNEEPKEEEPISVDPWAVWVEHELGESATMKTDTTSPSNEPKIKFRKGL